jgi:hypothetical protein
MQNFLHGACFTVAGTAHVDRPGDPIAARVSRLTAAKEHGREHQNPAIILAARAFRNVAAEERCIPHPENDISLSDRNRVVWRAVVSR